MLISKLPIAQQFLILASLGVALTIAGLGLRLKRSHDLAYDANRAEIQHEAEEATAATHFAGVNYMARPA